MLGPLRSPPPAANSSRASSTAQCTECSHCYGNLPVSCFVYRSCISCMNVEGLFRSKELREELNAHTIYGVDASTCLRYKP